MFPLINEITCLTLVSTGVPGVYLCDRVVDNTFIEPHEMLHCDAILLIKTVSVATVRRSWRIAYNTQLDGQ